MPAKRQLTLGYCPSNAPYNGVYPFNQVYDKARDVREGVDGCDAVVFWGGTDIHPSIYGRTHHMYNGASRHISDRDMFELQVITACKRLGIPMIGVCRGAQLMCAFAGGLLVQDCTGHGKSHDITVKVMPNVLKTVSSSSSHHQMMVPDGTNHELIAWSSRPLSIWYEGEGREDKITLEKEPEIVYFRDLKGLAIQGHPEWMAPEHDFVTICNNLVRQRLLEEDVAMA